MPLSRMPPTLRFALPAVAGRFGAWHLAILIIVVFLAILAALIVPLEVRLYRQRRHTAGHGAQEEHE